MNKSKRMFLMLASLFMASLLVIVYMQQYFQPTPVPLVLIDYARSVSIEYNDILDHIKEQDGKYYLLFCDGGVDCVFVNDNMLKPLSREVRQEDFPDLIFVDMSLVRSDISPARLNQLWGFTSFPAFVAVEVVEKQVNVLNVLQWGGRTPFGKAELKQWMINNQIWKGPE